MAAESSCQAGCQAQCQAPSGPAQSKHRQPQEQAFQPPLFRGGGALASGNFHSCPQGVVWAWQPPACETWSGKKRRKGGSPPAGRWGPLASSSFPWLLWAPPGVRSRSSCTKHEGPFPPQQLIQTSSQCSPRAISLANEAPAPLLPSPTPPQLCSAQQATRRDPRCSCC